MSEHYRISSRRTGPTTSVAKRKVKVTERIVLDDTPMFDGDIAAMIACLKEAQDEFGSEAYFEIEEYQDIFVSIKRNETDEEFASRQTKVANERESVRARDAAKLAEISERQGKEFVAGLL